MHPLNVHFSKIVFAIAVLLSATPAHADLAEQRRQFEFAHRLASQGHSYADQAKALQGYPLLAWVERRVLRRKRLSAILTSILGHALTPRQEERIHVA